jgi:hypothetical protein
MCDDETTIIINMALKDRPRWAEADRGGIRMAPKIVKTPF